MPLTELGKWIWMEYPEPARNFYLSARKSFSLTKKPTSAVLKASADSRYKLYINGRYVGKGPVRSGFGHTSYDEYNISEFLVKGKNVIAFLVHHFGENTGCCIVKRPGLLCKTEIDIDGEKQYVVTDETWKVRRATEWTDSGARIHESLGFQEVYDAALWPGNWTEVKFNEKGWQEAVAVGVPPSMPWGHLTPREIPPLVEEKILPHALVFVGTSPDRSDETPAADVPDIMAASELSDLSAKLVKAPEALLTNEGATNVKTSRNDSGVVFILDFGREVFGNAEIGIGGSGTGCIDIGYSEMLEDGHVKPNRGEMKYSDRILLKKGRLDWQSFEPRAFRYMQIEFRRCSKAVSLEYVRVNETTYPVEYTGSFECSDNLINEIWRTGAHTARMCMEDSLIDNPWRGRALRWGDARVTSRVAYYAFDDTELLAQGLRQVAHSQNRDGSIPGIYPAGHEALIPDFSLFWIYSLLDYYAFSEDTQLLKDLYPAVRRLLFWFDDYVGERGLLADVPGDLMIDWADMDKRGEVTALNALYLQGLRVASVIASITGNTEDAEHYIEQSNRLKMAINKYTYSPKRGLYAECIVDGKLVEKFSRQTNILVALADVPDHYQKASIYRQVLNGSLPELATPYFASHMLEALYAGERHYEALGFIRRKWGDMIRQGATTCWERFTPDAGLCHGWSVCPTRDLIAEYVGIKPVLGSHRFSIAPHIADLKWARGAIKTREGRLMVEWRVVRNTLTITVEVPGNLRVDVYPPAMPGATISVDGRSWPSSLVTVGSGTHRIRVVAPRPERPAAIDRSLAPKPIPHVELLEDVIHFGRRYPASALPRRRGGLRRREKVSPVEVEYGVEMEPLTQDLGAVEQIEGIELVTPGEALPEAEQPSKRKSRRRGGRGRSRKKREVFETQTAQEAPQPGEAVEAHAEVQPVEAAELISAEPASEEHGEHPAKRRRTRRGGRGRSRKPYTAADEQTPAEPQAESPASVEIEHVQPQPAIEPAAEPQAQEAISEEHRKRRTRRGGRGRSRPRTEQPAASEGHAPEPAVETPVEIAAEPRPMEEPALEVQKRRTRRGGRGRSRSKQAETSGSEEHTAAEAPAAPVTIEHTAAPQPEAVEHQAEEKPKRRTSTRGAGTRRRTKKAPPAGETAPEDQPPPAE